MSKSDITNLKAFHAKKDLWSIFNKLEDCVDDAGAEKLRKLIQDTINVIDIIIAEDNR